jgi:hypothetical protein
MKQKCVACPPVPARVLTVTEVWQFSRPYLRHNIDLAGLRDLRGLLTSACTERLHIRRGLYTPASGGPIALMRSQLLPSFSFFHRLILRRTGQRSFQQSLNKLVRRKVFVRNNIMVNQGGSRVYFPSLAYDANLSVT